MSPTNELIYTNISHFHFSKLRHHLQFGETIVSPFLILVKTEELTMTNQFDKLRFKSLLATTIREKEDSYVVNEIFNRFPSIQDLLEVTEEELLLIKGIGKVKSKQIIAALQLARMNPTPIENRFTIRSPQDAYEYLKDMQYHTQEHFVVVGLNTKNEVMFRETVFVGSLNSSIVHPHERLNI